MAHDVFISYAMEDRRIADVVCRALEKDGVACWYAPRDVPIGADYEEAIVDAISDSRLVLLILSSYSNNSPHVRREIQNACADEPPKPILPIRIEDVTLNKALRYYLSSAQWLDASTPPVGSHLPQLVKRLRVRLPRATRDETAAKEVSTPGEAKASSSSSDSAGRQMGHRDTQTADTPARVNGVAEDAAQLLEAVRRAAESQSRRSGDVRPAIEEQIAAREKPAVEKPVGSLKTSTRTAVGGKTHGRLSRATRRTLLVVGVSLVCLIAGVVAISYRLSDPVPRNQALGIGFLISAFLLFEGVMTYRLEEILTSISPERRPYMRGAGVIGFLTMMFLILVTWNNIYVRAGLEVQVRDELGNHVGTGMKVELYQGHSATGEPLRVGETYADTRVDFTAIAPGTYTVYVPASDHYNSGVETVYVDEREEQAEIKLKSAAGK